MKPSLKIYLSRCLAGLILLLCISPFTLIIRNTYDTFQRARDAQWNLDRLHQKYHSIYKTAPEAQKIIPPGAKVETSFKPLSIEWRAARYALYPLEISPEASYILEFPSQKLERQPGWPSRTFSDGTRLYTAPGSPARTTEASERSPAPKYPLHFFLLTVFLNGLTGALLLRLLRINAAEGGLFYFLGTGCLLGAVIYGLSLWLLLLCGVPLNPPSLWLTYLLWPLLLALLNFLIKAPREDAKGNPQLQTQPFNQGCRKTPAKSFSGLYCNGLKIWTILLVVLILILISLTPLTDWDSMSKWVLKAKILFYTQTLDFSYSHHNYYPILWPVILAVQFVLMGGAVHSVPQWLAAFFFLTALSQLWGALRFLYIPFKQKIFSVNIFIAAFFSYRLLATANAENIFLALTAGAIAAITAWLQDCRRKSYLVLAVIFNLGLCLVKFEGMITTFILATGLYFFHRRQLSSKQATPLLWMMLAVILCPLLWIGWTKAHGYYKPIVHLQLTEMSLKIPYLVQNNGRLFLRHPLSPFLILWGFSLYLSPNHKKWSSAEKWHTWSALGLIIFSIFGNIGQPFEEIQRTHMDAFLRLLLHASPPLLLLMASRSVRKNGQPDPSQAMG